MSTLNNTEDVVRRSLFGSIIGLKLKNAPPRAVPQASNPWANFNEEQPCSTQQLRQYDVQRANVQISAPPQHSSPPNPSTANDDSQNITQQMQNSLFVASPPHNNPSLFTCSPHDIYHEIVCECAPYEQDQCSELGHQITTAVPTATERNYPSEQFQQQWQQPLSQLSPPVVNTSQPNFPHSMIQYPQSQPLQLHQTQHQHSEEHRNVHSNPNPQLSFTPQLNLPKPQKMMCPNCYHIVTPIPSNDAQPQQIITKDPHAQLKALLGGGVSLEELVKLIVSTVRDSSTPKSPAPGRNESPEEILRRKRQQNNEAAARYRRRQKEARMTNTEELDYLASKNTHLRGQIGDIQEEMKRLKTQIQRKSK